MSVLRSILFLLCAFAAASAWAVDRNVPADFPTIQAALDAALDGDRVVVAPGRYYEVLRFPARKIHMIASAGPRLTVIDAQELGTVVSFEGAPGRDTVLEGFTLTNGLDREYYNAGGVHVGEGASPVVRGNVIRQNQGYGDGHGVSLFRTSSPLLEGNEIRHNRGGGIGIWGNACFGAPNCGAEIRNNYIGNNYLTNFSSGGGIYLSGARAIIVGNVIEYNTARGNGGGLSSDSSVAVLIENNLFHANLADRFGGGLYASGSPIIINNTFVGNEASISSAVHSRGPARIANNLISAIGSATALYCDPMYDSPAPLARHNIVHAAQGVAYGGMCAGMSGVNGNQFAAPVFAGEFDFRLQPDSPGVDQGDGSQSSQNTDLAGRARIADGNGDGVAVIDVGAYELPHPLIFSDSFESTP